MEMKPLELIKDKVTYLAGECIVDGGELHSLG